MNHENPSPGSAKIIKEGTCTVSRMGLSFDDETRKIQPQPEERCWQTHRPPRRTEHEFEGIRSTMGPRHTPKAIQIQSFLNDSNSA